MHPPIVEAPTHVGLNKFLTENERKVVELLKPGPKVYGEIVASLKKKGFKDRRTINNLLNSMEGKKIFRVEIDGKIFYRLDVFPFKIHLFFKIADETKFPELLEVKKDVLSYYPNVSFESILKNHREFFELAKPAAKGIITLLKLFERYDISRWDSE